MNNNIKYLIKFVTNEEHAQALQNGNLFMRPIVSYIKMYYDEYFKSHPAYDDITFNEYAKTYSGCIGDLREGTVIPNVRMLTNIDLPVFSMTLIYDSQTATNEHEQFIFLNKHLIDNLIDSNYTHCLIIKYSEFKQNIDKINSSEINLAMNSVIYDNSITTESMNARFGFKCANSIFYKHPDFSYQSEFRLVLNSPMNLLYRIYDNKCEIYNRITNEIYTNLPFYKKKIDDMKNYSQILSLNSIEKLNNNYMITL